MNQDHPALQALTGAVEAAPTPPAAESKYPPIVTAVPRGATAECTHSAYQTVYAAHRAACAEEMIVFKASLFGALARSGVMLIEVKFDGCGDAGQIESIHAQNGAQEEVDLPTEAISFMERVFDTSWPCSDPAAPGETGTIYKSTVKVVNSPVTEAIEKTVYDLLRETHQGWEDNDGAFGLFRFDTRDQTITLEYNERYTETNYSEHEW